MKRAALLLLLCFAALVISGAVFADPPTDPTPPAGYVYDGSQTVNAALSQSVGSNIINDPGFDYGWWTLESGWSISGGVATHVTGASSAFYQSNSLVENDFYEVQFDIVSASGSGCVQMFLGVGGSASSCYGSVATYQSLLRHTTAVAIAGLGASYDFHGSVDNIVVRPFTRAATHSATADGTHTLNFSLPASPLAGQRIELRYRVADNENYMAARLQRNAANTNWDVSLISVTNTVTTVRISQSSVGNITALRVMSVEDYHYVYAGSGGSFTYLWTINDASHNSATGVTGIWNDAFSSVSVSSWSIVDESSITPTPTTTATAPTVTPTATPTPNYYVELVTPGGEPARLVRETRPAQLMTNILLFALLVSSWLMYIVNRLGKQNVKN